MTYLPQELQPRLTASGMLELADVERRLSGDRRVDPFGWRSAGLPFDRRQTERRSKDLGLDTMTCDEFQAATAGVRAAMDHDDEDYSDWADDYQPQEES